MLTEQEYKELREKIDAHKNWLEARDYKSYRTEECPEDLRVTNEQRSAVEVYEWENDPPEQYFAYVNGKHRTVDGITYRPTITTWMGDTLGYVIFGVEYRSCFGDKRVPMCVTGTNGKKYYGTYYKSAGDYCRLKAYKDGSMAYLNFQRWGR